MIYRWRTRWNTRRLVSFKDIRVLRVLEAQRPYSLRAKTLAIDRSSSGLAPSQRVLHGPATGRAEDQMAWEQRGGRRSYYRSVRKDGRVRKVYFGNGSLARKAALDDQERAEADRTRRRAAERLRDQLLAIETIAAEGTEHFLERAARCLDAAGYHYHRGTWRKRRARPTHERRPNGDADGSPYFKAISDDSW